MTTLTAFPVQGWFEVTSTGIGIVYLAISDEGMTTGTSDTPANVQYRPRVLNPDQFSIEIAPGHWIQGDVGSQGSSFGQLEIDNYDGAFNALLRADMRDCIVIIKEPPAGALLTGTTIRDAPTAATAIVDSVSSDNEDHLLLTLKDIIATLDHQLPVKYEPPFVDSGAANNPMPLTFGAFRNRTPLLISTPDRIFRLHDANIPNITQIADKGAPLDPHAKIPQYTPALDGCGFQLAVMPVGKPTADGSSYGTQAIIPGAADVLGGDGKFLGTWTGSPAVPPGFTFSNNSGASITEVTNIFGSGVNAATITSATLWQPGFSYGDQIKRSACLKGGYTYRLNFAAFGIVAAPSLDLVLTGGIIVATKLTGNVADYVAGFKSPIQGIFAGKQQVSQNLSFEFTVPAGATRDLFIIVTPSSGFSGANGTCTATIYNVTLEELGQFVDQPVKGMPLANYFTEILVLRDGNDPSVFNASDLDAIGLRADGVTRVPWGITFDQAPNVLDALKVVTSTFGCFTPFADNLGVVRTRQFVDPSDPSLPIVADFTMDNVERPISIEEDKAPNLTTVWGARPNCSIFAISDFVTDQAIVPQDTKTRFMRAAQFELTSSRSPAGFYSHAVNAPIFVTRFDESADCQIEADRSVGIYCANVYSDATITNGKRLRVTFTAHYDDITKLGVTVQTNAATLLPGDIVRLSYSSADNADGTPGAVIFDKQRCEVVRRKLYPFAHKIEVTVCI